MYQIFLVIFVLYLFFNLMNRINIPIIKDINNFNPLKSYNVYTYIETPTNYNNEKKIQLLSKNLDTPIFFKLCLELMELKINGLNTTLIVLNPENYLDYVSDFPIKMCPTSEYSLKNRVDLLSAYVLEQNGGLFISPGTIVYNLNDILSNVNSFNFVTFGRSKYNPNSYIIGSKHNSEFIKTYKNTLTQNFPVTADNILQKILSENEFKNSYHYSGEYDGSISKSNNEIFISDYLGKTDILYKNIDNLSLISVPYSELLRNQEYKWFNNLSRQQFYDSDIFVSRLLKKLLKI